MTESNLAGRIARAAVLASAAALLAAHSLAAQGGSAPAQASHDTVYEESQVDTRPQMVDRRQFILTMTRNTAMAKSDRSTPATVKITYVVGPDGSVASVTVDSTSDATLADAIADAVRHTRFTPGERNGHPVAVRQGFAYKEAPATAQERAEAAAAPAESTETIRIGGDPERDRTRPEHRRIGGRDELVLVLTPEGSIGMLANAWVVHQATEREYPAELRAQRAGGSAMVLVTVRPDGTVENATVDSATRPELRDPAVRVAQVMRFRVSVEGGNPSVRFHFLVPVTFNPE
jgi:TonB family protein